jgi:hypothetical protein
MGRFMTRDLFDKVNREHTISEIHHGYRCSCGFVTDNHYTMDVHKSKFFQEACPDWLKYDEEKK